MFLYTENNNKSHRNTQNINMQPKAHQTHENTFHFYFISPKPKTNINISEKKKHQGNQRCMLIVMSFFILLRATQPNQFDDLGDSFIHPVRSYNKGRINQQRLVYTKWERGPFRTIYDIRYTIYEIRYTIYEIRYTIYEIFQYLNK